MLSFANNIIVRYVRPRLLRPSSSQPCSFVGPVEVKRRQTRNTRGKKGVIISPKDEYTVALCRRIVAVWCETPSTVLFYKRTMVTYSCSYSSLPRRDNFWGGEDTCRVSLKDAKISLGEDKGTKTMTKSREMRYRHLPSFSPEHTKGEKYEGINSNKDILSKTSIWHVKTSTELCSFSLLSRGKCCVYFSTEWRNGKDTTAKVITL